MQSIGIVLAAGLAFIHAFIARLNVFILIPEHRWLSFAGGVSIGYVFLEIFPELSHAQEELEHSEIVMVAFLENHVYLLALVGLLMFYGLDILALASRRHNREVASMDRTNSTIFWINISAFALLNAIFGYLLQDVSNHTLIRCVLFFAAVALHFFVIDFHLRDHHKGPYDRQGRWLLAGAIMIGAFVGQSIHLNEAALSIVWSFLAGGLILNILKHELPDETKSCFWSFLGGTTLYASLLLLI